MFYSYSGKNKRSMWGKQYDPSSDFIGSMLIIATDALSYKDIKIIIELLHKMQPEASILGKILN